MKTGIHPQYFPKAEILCACGTHYTVGSTDKGPMHVELCAHCHPFYTGKQKLVDTAGRVDRYKKILEASAAKPRAVKKPRIKRPKTEKETPVERIARLRAARAKKAE